MRKEISPDYLRGRKAGDVFLWCVVATGYPLIEVPNVILVKPKCSAVLYF